MSSSLKDFIHSLDPKSLPRILQIQSGFYDEGSTEEKLGHLCSLSTGDVIKVVGFKVKTLIASNCENEDESLNLTTVELPLNFPGLCRIVADKTPYSSIEEIVRKVLIGPTALQQPCFYCSEDLKAEKLTIRKGEKIIFRSVEDSKGMMIMHGEVTRNGRLHGFVLPVSTVTRGDFYEWKDDQTYTLKEIAEWKIPKSRCRSVIFTNPSNTGDSTNVFPAGFDGSVVLTPIYEVQAVMKFQKEIVHFLSNLDVEVKDVTHSYNINSFLQPLSMEDILERSEFPIVVALIEGSIGNKQSCNVLYPGKELVIYKKHQATRILASEIKRDLFKRHFLIPTSYKGKFKRKFREFPTAYDLEIAKSVKEQLHVKATKAFESPHEELHSVSIGDQFLVPQCQTSEIVDQEQKKVENALACEQILSPNNCKNVLLPMCLEGGFVEIVHDKRQYELLELIRDFCLPFNVKVSIGDLSTQEDILADIPCLQLEEEITDSFLLISSLSNPTEIWEVPVHNLNMTFQLLRKHGKDIMYFPEKSTVEEITEEQYCMMRRYKNQAKNPPPRPPKTSIPEKTKTTVPAENDCASLRPVKNFYVDTVKKQLSDQAAAVSGLQLSYQSDLEHQENKEDVSGTATLVEDLAKNMLAKYRTENKPKVRHDLDDENENATESLTKMVQENTVNKAKPLKKRDEKKSSGNSMI
ncbi:protein THEMIS [Hemicordylus capensis]|uniref:protein THEMIS n=1 Tax=Hemicordylus capensis TaxID=884348 RepID=UPI00230248AE|nr:protein THEMIS [Hemicordylus capensis]